MRLRTKSRPPRAPWAPPTRSGSRTAGWWRTTPTASPSWTILRASAPGLDLKDRLVALLGAGGAARASIFAFLEAGASEVRIFNRTRERADAIARHFGAAVKPYDWSRRVDGSREAALLVNATSLGMQGAGDLDMDVSRLDAKCVVADIVYVPLVTPLLAAAACARACHRRWSRHVPASGGAGLREMVRRASRRHRRAARPGRRRHRGALMLVVALTGSIGMGKTTVAARLRQLGIAVFDADAQVHALYEGAAVAPIEAAFPGTTAAGPSRPRQAQQGIARQARRFRPARSHRPSPGAGGRARNS